MAHQNKQTSGRLDNLRRQQARSKLLSASKSKAQDVQGKLLASDAGAAVANAVQAQRSGDPELEKWAVEQFLANRFEAVVQRFLPLMGLQPDAQSISVDPADLGTVRVATALWPAALPEVATPNVLLTAKTILVLGVCLRRLENNPPAYGCFKYLATRRFTELMVENQLDVLDGLTACAIAQGDKPAASSYGKQALHGRARVFVKSPLDWAGDWQQQLQSAPGQGLQVISYSLYGHKPVYTEMLAMSLSAAPVLFPGWQVWVYVDETVPAAARERLTRAGAILKDTGSRELKFPKTTWRFLALEDEQVERVIFRDADSFLTPREVPCVREWMASGAAVHSIRDWFTHSELLLAGMWGARAAGFRKIRQALEHFVERPFTPSHGDQHFLRRYVWPYAQHSVVVHDSVFRPDGSKPVPSPAEPTLAAHIGNRLSRFVGLPLPQHLASRNTIEVVIEAGGYQLGIYELPVQSGKAVIELPNRIDDLMREGKMTLKIKS